MNIKNIYNNMLKKLDVKWLKDVIYYITILLLIIIIISQIIHLIIRCIMC